MHDDWSNATVLVTGAGGFIGSHLTETLLQRGATVSALVKYNGTGHWGHLESLPLDLRQRCQIHLGDITDPHFVRHLVRGCDVVFHLAALIGIPYSYVAPQHYVQVNVQGTLNVLEACRQEGIPRLVHTSTSEAYGTARFTPITEDHPLQGQSPYSASKIAADKLAESYHCSFGLPVVTLRPFNTYGPRQSSRAFIPTVITQALTQPVVRVGSLDPVRDLNFVSDTVEAFLAVAQCDAAIGQVLNAASGRAVTMGQVLQTILELTGKTGLPVKQEAQRVRPDHSEVMVLQGDSTLLTELTGWQSTVPLEQGLAHTVAWVADRLDHYKPTVYAV